MGTICFPKARFPAVVRFGLGAAIESLLIFLLLLAGWANWVAFLAIGLVPIAALFWIQPRRFESRTESVSWLFILIFGFYGVLYFVNALAPEIQPDAAGYHLGLVAEYVRLGHFPRRIGFFEMVPQGLEMLFTVAFAFGKHSAAKLVHFAFLAASVPLLRVIGRELQLSDRVSLSAAALYFCAPVVGVSGTSAYNDAGMVFFVLLAFYLLLRKQWAAAGLAAGFCFAIKITGLWITPLAALAARRFRPALIVLTAALTMIAPWTIRNAVLTANPVAPLFNRVFPNPYFRPSTDERLSESMRNYPGFRWRSAALDYTVRGNLQGLIGPAFLLLPIGLLAMRTRNGRFVWAAAILLPIPWLWNSGARFLMPALPFWALAIVLALPKPLAWGCVALQAIACWPAAMALYTAPFAWRLEDFPWRAALRIEPEATYLARKSADYKVARMVEANTKTSDRIFSLDSLAMAYSTREVITHWQSARGNQLADALAVAVQRPPLIALQFNWDAAAVRGLRFRVAASGREEWKLFETQLFLNGERVFNSPMWLMNARPNIWEAPLALDENRATCWRTGSGVEKGMFVEIEFDRPQMLTRAELLCAKPWSYVAIEVDGLGPDGHWRLLGDAPRTTDVPNTLPDTDLRREALQALKAAGFTHVLAGWGDPIGNNMWEHAGDWGLADVGEVGPVHLFRVL